MSINDYICLTDLARYKKPEHADDVIKNWIRNRNTIELLGFWEISFFAEKHTIRQRFTKYFIV